MYLLIEQGIGSSGHENTFLNFVDRKERTSLVSMVNVQKLEIDAAIRRLTGPLRTQIWQICLIYSIMTGMLQVISQIIIHQGRNYLKLFFHMFFYRNVRTTFTMSFQPLLLK